MEQEGPVTATIRIAATPDEVFHYLVDPALIVEWIGTSARLDAQPGGVFALDVDSYAARGTYLAVEPPNRVVFTWGVEGNDTLPAGSTMVEIRLVSDGDETVVELTHRDLPPEWRSPHKTGWTSYLARLRQAAG